MNKIFTWQSIEYRRTHTYDESQNPLSGIEEKSETIFQPETGTAYLPANTNVEKNEEGDERVVEEEEEQEEKKK